MYNENCKSEKRTLLMSVLMSAPGPLIVGLGFIMGKSSTQLSDFVRRSAELAGIIAAYITYCLANTKEQKSAEKKQHIEKLSNLIVGSMMILAGSIMTVLALSSTDTETGNVIPGLCVAVLGVIANTLFWIKYTKLNNAGPDAIIAVQAKLYRAKSLVDICVTTALLSVVLFPGSGISRLLDTVGAAIVAVYLAWSGVKTVIGAIKREGTAA